MKKIIVIGCPGSGKSSFARALHNRTGIPLYHLDRMYWNADKTTVEKSVFLERLETVLDRETWIIDGTYASTMARRMAACDTVFFLDYPLDVCLRGIAERRGKPRSDMPWVENEEDAEFVAFVKNFRKQNRPQILALLEQHKDKNIHVFQAREQAIAFLRERVPMTLQTSRLILRPWREEDAEDLYRYASDPDVGTPAGWLPHTSVENSREIIRTVFSPALVFAVCRKEDGRAIGSVGLHRNDLATRDDEYELGYWLGKPFWGQGIIPEASREVLRYAFEEIGMRRIWCGYYDDNVKSRRVMEKLGFSYHHTSEGLEIDLLGEIRTGHAMLLTREAWDMRKERGTVASLGAKQEDVEN